MLSTPVVDSPAIGQIHTLLVSGLKVTPMVEVIPMLFSGAEGIGQIVVTVYKPNIIFRTISED